MTADNTARDKELSSETWDKSIAELKEELDPQVFAAYISPLKFSSYQSSNSELIVSGPSRLVCNHVDENFRDRLVTLFSNRLGVEKIKIKFAVDSNFDKKLSENSSPKVVVKRKKVANRDAIKQIGLKKSSLNPRYNFSNFVVGNSNQFCFAAASRVAEQPGESYNPLFIYGGVGLGKTHLLHAIGNSVLEKRPSAKILYMSSETFTNELIQSLRHAKMDEFKNRLRNIEVLLIDDIQFIAGKERTQEEFFHTFNALYNSKHQIVITSDKIPQEIPGIEERLKTRFSWGLTADLQAPDFETRVAILNRKALLDKCSLPESVSHLIAEKISSNVRELEGALTRLHAISSIKGVPITEDLAVNTLKPILEPKVINVSVNEIKSVVAEHFNIKVSEMVSKRRTKNLSFPRHVAMYLCRKHTTCSYPEIGSHFGGRDHSSVIHAANVVSGKLEKDLELRNVIEELERKLLRN